MTIFPSFGLSRQFLKILVGKDFRSNRLLLASYCRTMPLGGLIENQLDWPRLIWEGIPSRNCWIRILILYCILFSCPPQESFSRGAEKPQKLGPFSGERRSNKRKKSGNLRKMEKREERRKLNCGRGQKTADRYSSPAPSTHSPLSLSGARETFFRANFVFTSPQLLSLQ